MVATRPQLALLYAWALLLGSRPAGMVEHLLQTVEAREETAGWTGVIRGYVQLFQGQMAEARRQATRALATLPPEAVFLRQLAALVHSIAARYDDGADPEQALAEASRAGAAARNIFVAVLGLCLRADLALRRGDLTQAQAIYEQALGLAKGENSRPLPVASEPLLGLATLALERFELAQAERLLQDGIALTRQWSRVAALDGYLPAYGYYPNWVFSSYYAGEIQTCLLSGQPATPIRSHMNGSSYRCTLYWRSAPFLSVAWMEAGSNGQANCRDG